MQEDQMNQMNTDENDLQQNYQNNYSVPEYNIPQGDINNQGMNQQPYIPPQNYNYNNISNYSENNNISQNSSQISSNNVKNTSNPMIWEIISFLSWLLFISAKWDNYVKSSSIEIILYYPVLYNRSMVQLFTLIISSLGFLIYLKYIIYSKDNNLYQGLFGDKSKYHFVPLLLYSTICIIFDREFMKIINRLDDFEGPDDDNPPYSNAFSEKAFGTFYMLFSIFTLASIIYIYMKTEMNCEWYMIMTIKKGIYSVIIAESVHCIFESIFYLRLVTAVEDIENLFKTGGVFLVILISAIIISFAIYSKNIILLFINFLMYFGMTINYYSKSADLMKSDGVAVIDIIMIVANFVLIAFMIIKYKEQLLDQ